MKITSTAILICAILINSLMVTAQTRGVGVRVADGSGGTKEIELYKGSYALVIGNSRYTNGWDSLAGVAADVAAVRNALEANGFTVETAENLTGDEFRDRLRRFIDDHGFEPENRLLIYYAGHGHTLASSGDKRDLGYVVPVDAPLPKQDERGFKQRAVTMDDIQNYAKRIEAKHALFLFDSCFSGKLVSRNAITVPPVIEEKVSLPVRQFITAGAADQPVPDESIFRRAFIRALEGEADTNSDGYITGTELAEYLKEKVTNYTNRAQTPQYGKINDINLDRGDFVFTVSKGAGSPPIPTTPAADPNAAEKAVWERVRNSQTRTDYELFLKTFPDGIYAGEARTKYEQIWWNSIKDSSEKSEFEGFLKEFPNGQYRTAAEFAVKLLEKSAGENGPSTNDALTPEQQCIASVPGKVAWNKAGNTNWEETNVRALCQGTTDAAATIACFQTEIGKNDKWDQALNLCRAGAADLKEIKAGTAYRNFLGMDFVYIPPGKFMMGSETGDKDEKPVHEVTISKGFWLGAYEVTQAQYQRVMGTNPSKYAEKCGPGCPVDTVLYDDAEAFVEKLNQMSTDGSRYRLPTEAEWEYAARAGSTGDYAGELDEMGWHKDNAGKQTHPVGQKKPNAWGLYDMHGNVTEWVADNFDKYPAEAVTDPFSSRRRAPVYRGGSFNDKAKDLRSSNRAYNPPTTGVFFVGFAIHGFRVVRMQ